MSYTPTNWSNKKAPGISDKNLNKIENELVKLDKIVSVPDITETTDTTMPNSYDGRLKVEKIKGVCQQGANPSPTSPQEIKKSVVSGVKTHGKNLLDVELVDGVKAGITYTLNADKSITISGTRTGGSHYLVGSAYLKAGNYTYGVAKGSFENMHNVFIKPNGELSSSSKNPLVFAVTEENEGLYEFCLKGITNDVACSGTVYLQVEEGGVVTEYEPYTESSITLSNPIDLYGIGDVQDVIIRKDGVFGVEQKYGTTDLTGATWVKNAEYQYYTSLDDSKYKRNNRTTVMCDRLISGSGATNGIQTNTYGKIRANIVTEEDTVNAVAEAMNGAIVVAELIEYNFVPLPTVDQIALNSLATYDGITYLEFDSEVQPTFEGEYGTSKVGGYTLEALLTARSK